MPADTTNKSSELASTLRKVDRYWRKIGMPAKTRLERSEALREYLEVVNVAHTAGLRTAGPDIPTLAEAWAYRDVRRRVLDLMLRSALTAFTSFALLSLIGPLALGLDEPGLSGGGIALVALLSIAIVVVGLLRVYRTVVGRSIELSIILLGAAAAAMLGLFVPTLDANVRIGVPASALVGLVLCAIAVAIALWLLRRSWT
jgi:hypothetical protein